MNRLVPILSILILIAAAYTASVQFQQSSSQSDNETAESYASIPPYLDEAPPKLEKTIHELKGLVPATSQGQLPDILKKAGTMADGLIQKIPDLAADEAVSQSQRGERNSSQTEQTFTYLLLIHPDQTGALRLQEFRTTQKGKPLGQGAGTPNFSGFLSAWLVFSPAHQAESRFRYLGQQQMQGRSTFVIGFAQLPSAASSGKDGNDKNTGHILLQGIAWVDQSDFRIVRLRTDLLTPQASIRLKQQTTTIIFGPVKIEGVGVELWLPQTATLDMQSYGQYFHEEHKYSNYRPYATAAATASRFAGKSANRATPIMMNADKFAFSLQQ